MRQTTFQRLMLKSGRKARKTRKTSFADPTESLVAYYGRLLQYLCSGHVFKENNIFKITRDKIKTSSLQSRQIYEAPTLTGSIAGKEKCQKQKVEILRKDRKCNQENIIRLQTHRKEKGKELWKRKHTVTEKESEKEASKPAKL